MIGGQLCLGKQIVMSFITIIILIIYFLFPPKNIRLLFQMPLVIRSSQQGIGVCGIFLIFNVLLQFIKGFMCER